MLTARSGGLDRMFRELLVRLKRHEEGASMVEYALLVILIAIVALIAVQLAGSQLSQTYSEIASSVANA
jgi:pilus assembly protein Flp/PilA